MTESTTPFRGEELFQRLAQSGLWKDELLREQVARFSQESSSTTILNQLVEEHWLTAFQARQLVKQPGRGFFLSEKFKILEFLGKGGTSRVLLCEHLLLQRLVAVKLPNPSMGNVPGATERFLREARATAALDHPNIARVFDADQTSQGPCLVMEYVDGTNLHDLAQRQGLMSIERVAHYISQAALGLQQAHLAGLAHRDVKPANLMLDRTGIVKVLDLGLARFFDPERSDNLTQKIDASSIMGTADYIAPEQVMETSSADIRSDIYSLGYTMYYLLTKSLPAGPGSAMRKMIWHQTHEADPVQNYRQDVPEELVAVLNRMVRKNPDERYQTPEEVLLALTPWTSDPIAPPSDQEMPQIRAASYRLGLSSIPDSSRICDVVSLFPPAVSAGSEQSIKDSSAVNSAPNSSAGASPSTIDVVKPSSADTKRTLGITSADTAKVLSVNTDTERTTRDTLIEVRKKNALRYFVQRYRVSPWFAVLGSVIAIVFVFRSIQWLSAIGTSPRFSTTGAESQSDQRSGFERMKSNDSVVPLKNQNVVLRAGGSTMIRPVMEYWARIYEQQTGVKIEYSTVNSSKGIEGVIANFLDFGCSDVFLTDEELAATGTRMVHIPLALGAVIPTYNVIDLSGQPLSLRFTGAMLANIYLGRITKWNDPAISVINPGVELPDQEIQVIYRDESSGATALWTSYLSRSSIQWQSQVGQGNQVPWPIGVPAGKNDGIADSVSRTAGSIGYVELSHAIANSLSQGQVKNHSNFFIQASTEGIRAAADSLAQIPADLRYSVIDAPGTEAYPIVGTCWAIVRIDQRSERSQALIEFLRWATTEGQTHLDGLQFGRLPREFAAPIEAAIKEIKVTKS